MKNKGKILILSLSYPPNIGGVETHLHDFVKHLNKLKWPAILVTYHPITTKAHARSREVEGSVEINRIRWFGSNLFFKFKDSPLLEFMYLVFPLTICGIWQILKHRDIQTVHAHGLIAGFAAVVIGKILRKKIIISTHSIYHFPRRGIYHNFSYFIFRNGDELLTLSNQSKKELVSLGISKEKIHVFTYWVDQDLFKPMNKRIAKKSMGWDGKFIALFVGRLIEEKGIDEFLKAAKFSKGTDWVVVGTGPLENIVREAVDKCQNIFFLKSARNVDLPTIYNAADLLIVPSTHEEGFGRVILESLSCGTPVIAANRGGIREAMSDKVGELIEISPERISQAVRKLKEDSSLRMDKSKTAINFAKEKFSEKNAHAIINLYE